MPDASVLAAAMRSDLAAFIQKAFQTVSPEDRYRHNWHIEAIAYQLGRCLDRQCRRLIVTQPPRSLKSICASVAFVAWALGRNPKLRFICVSYSDALAAALARQFRQVVNSGWYRALFPGTRLSKDTGTECVTTAGGGRLATSIGGTLTGRGADMIIVDDPLKAEDASSKTVRDDVNEWYTTALVSRLNDKARDVTIVLMQRLHEDDLAGHLLQSGDWHHLNLPAIAEEDQSIALGPEHTHDRKRGDVLHPGRESLPTLMRIKEEVGSLTFSAQYQQRPVPHEGNLIKREWLKYYDQLPERDIGWQIVQSWDVATTVNKSSDYSVCTTWAVHRKTCCLVEVWRGQRRYPGVKRAIVQRALAQRVNTILIEKAGPGLHLVQELRHNGDARVPAPIGIQPEGDKLSRTEAQLTDFESGRVLLPRHAPWLGEFLNELLAFPNSRHDDQVDSVTQFLGWQRGRQRRRRRISTVAPTLVPMEG